MEKFRLLCVALAICLFWCAMPSHAQVTGLDENRLLNSWFEIARKPNKPQKQCAANNSNLIARGEGKGQLRWLWVCTDKKGNTDTHGMLAKPTGKPGSGRYKVQVIWLILHRNYEVVAVAEDNSWMVLGTPNHKQLWIYAAKPELDAATLASARSRAEAAGFHTDKLIQQPQSNPAKPATAAATP